MMVRMRQISSIAVLMGLTMFAAALVFLGVQWWSKGVPVSKGQTVTGSKAKVLSVAVILLGLALGLIGWLTLPGIIMP
jgi:hypothetical protein